MGLGGLKTETKRKPKTRLQFSAIHVIQRAIFIPYSLSFIKSDQ
jgi:hypothetical protein